MRESSRTLFSGESFPLGTWRCRQVLESQVLESELPAGRLGYGHLPQKMSLPQCRDWQPRSWGAGLMYLPQMSPTARNSILDSQVGDRDPGT